MNSVQTTTNQAEQGRRLREAREAAGLTLQDASVQLKTPARVLGWLESGEWDRLGAPVFVRGQLRSYAKLLELRLDDPVLDSVPSAPPEVLQPRTYTPRMHMLADSLARRAVYIVLTALIAVPVFLTMRSHMGDTPGGTTSLDVPVANGTPTHADAAGQRSASAHETVVASFAPPPAPHAPALSLQFDGDSWVRINGTDGAVIESGLVKAGEQRSYDAGQVARMVLGNASQVRVARDGQPQDLTPYLRSNVARFTVSSDGSLSSPNAQ